MRAGIVWCPHCKNPHRLGELFCSETGNPLDQRVHHNVGGRPQHPLIGTVLDGKYEVIKRIGVGGMGEVFEALDRKLERSVAIKIVAHAGDEAAERLRREAEVIASIQHPNICDVYDFGSMPNGSPYLVLERLTGETLESFQRKRVFPQRAIDLFLQILSALEHAHAAGIIHRDLKPANVFLVDRVGCPPLVKVLDFGFAKDLSGRRRAMTRPGKTCGTPQYMSPEQLCARPIDGRSDIFSVGIMLFEVLTQRHPFDGPTVLDMTLKIVHEQPSNRERLERRGSVDLASVVLRALEKKASARFGSAIEMQTALASVELADDDAITSSDSQSVPHIEVSDGSRSSN